MQPLPQQDGLGFLIATARRHIKQAVWSRVEKYDLTPPQFWVIVGLMRRGETSLFELAARIRSDNPTASRIVSALVARGLVKSDVHREDRRRAALRLTAKGRRLGEKLLPIAAEIRAGVERGFTPGERAQAVAVLTRIIENAAALEQPRGARR